MCPHVCVPLHVLCCTAVPLPLNHMHTAGQDRIGLNMNFAQSAELLPMQGHPCPLRGPHTLNFEPCARSWVQPLTSRFMP